MLRGLRIGFDLRFVFFFPFPESYQNDPDFLGNRRNAKQYADRTEYYGLYGVDCSGAWSRLLIGFAIGTNGNVLPFWGCDGGSGFLIRIFSDLVTAPGSRKRTHGRSFKLDCVRRWYITGECSYRNQIPSFQGKAPLIYIFREEELHPRTQSCIATPAVLSLIFLKGSKCLAGRRWRNYESVGL